jgi:hypothetical protein
MTECLNAVGFVFNNVKTYIKKDKSCKYSNAYCQNCISNNKNYRANCDPIITQSLGMISPCNKCSNNSQYKICIFKLKKEHFISSSLEISTSQQDAWEEFKKNIIYQTNGNFVVSITKRDNTFHSFYANMIKAKKCNCCESVLLYFKYNIISLAPCSQLTNPTTYPDEIQPQKSPYNIVCANYESNITHNLCSGLYKSVRFFNSSNYNYSNYVANCSPCISNNIN